MKNAWLIYINVSSEKGTLQSKLIMQVLGALTGIQTNIFKTDVFFGRLSDSLSQLLLLTETKRGLFIKDPVHSHLLQDVLRRRCSAPHSQQLCMFHWKMRAFIPRKIYAAFI